MVSYGGVPIVWRSDRRTTVTLSTAESELLSMLDGAIAMKGVETILVDAGETISSRTTMSDSTSARRISTGSSSWRTRHLRIKASWLSEQISHGMFSAVQCPGERQWADILTKALSAARTKALLDLWGVRGYEERQVQRVTTPMVSARAVVALLCCLMMVSVQAAEDSQLPSRGSSVQVDWDTAGLLMILLMLGALVLWEAIRWSVIEIYHEYLPGASARKLNSVSYKRQPPRP